MFKRLQKFIIGLFWLSITLYGLGVTLYTILQFTIGERFIVVTWLNNGAYLLWAGAIVLLVPCIIFRRFRILLLMLIPTLAFTINYLPMYISREVNPPTDAEILTIMTYNINVRPRDLNKIADDIWQADADIVAIQELTPQSAEVFERQLSTLYPYRALHPINGFSGQAILSKYPIIADEFWTIYLGHQRAVIDVDGTEVTLYNVHPIHHVLPFWGFDTSLRTEEINVFMEDAIQDTTPVIIMGDFNMTDQSSDYQRVTEYFYDSYRRVGYGMGTTFPAHIRFLPTLVRIDYVFHSYDFTPLKADVLRTTGGSDHRPLVVELALSR